VDLGFRVCRRCRGADLDGAAVPGQPARQGQAKEFDHGAVSGDLEDLVTIAVNRDVAGAVAIPVTGVITKGRPEIFTGLGFECDDANLLQLRVVLKLEADGSAIG